MKKNKILCMLMIVGILFLTSTCVFADVPTNPPPGTIPSKFKTTLPNLWATIMSVVQIVAIACVVFAGVRYMFAGSEQKADIKKGMISLVIGGVLVFGAVTIIQVISTII